MPRSLNPTNPQDRQDLFDEKHLCRYEPPTVDEIARQMDEERCQVCGGSGELRDAVQAWDIPGAPIPECPHCKNRGDGPTAEELEIPLDTPSET